MLLLVTGDEQVGPRNPIINRTAFRTSLSRSFGELET